MASEIKVVLRHADGSLHVQGTTYGDGSDIETACQSGCQAVAVYLIRDVPGGPFMTEFSGNSMYSVINDQGGVSIAAHDIQPTLTRQKDYDAAGGEGPWRIIDPKLADAYMGQGACWDVFEDGQGSVYEAALAQARVLVGYPPS
jgi:hypothetical protein